MTSKYKCPHCKEEYGPGLMVGETAEKPCAHCSRPLKTEIVLDHKGYKIGHRIIEGSEEEG